MVIGALQEGLPDMGREDGDEGVQVVNDLSSHDASS